MRGYFTELKYRLAAAVIICAAVVAGAVSWSFAQAPETAGPGADLTSWAAQRAPGGTDFLITADAGQSPRGTLDTAQLSNIANGLGMLLDRVGADEKSFANIKAEDLQWASDKAVFMGRWPREGEPVQCGLILSVKDESRARVFLDSRLEDIPHVLRDGLVYAASSDKMLKSISGGSGDKVLAGDPKFQNARQRVKYGRYAFVYADLSYAAPQAAELLDSVINEDQDDDKEDKIDLSGVRALASSLRCLAGGEDYLGQRLQGELYLLADTAKSGQLGRVLFNPACNIEHPALEQRAADTQVCFAVNMKYNYDFLYALLAAHPETRELRAYPDELLSPYGLTMEKDIWGKLLTGSMVFSVRKFDYSALLAEPRTAEEEDGGADSGQTEQKDKPAKAKAADRLLKSLANSDWRFSADLRSRQNLNLMAERLPLLQNLIDGRLAQDASQKQPDSAAERLRNLPPAKVVGNTVWVAGSPAACGPAGADESRLGQNACWKALQAMTGGLAASVWVRNNEAILSGLVSQNDLSSQPLLNAMLSLLHKRGRMQCGSMVIIPDGVRFCEVVEGEL